MAHYRRVRIDSIYDGIDAVMYGSSGTLEYDFAVAAQADTRMIRLQVAGAEKLSIDAEGDLLIEMAGGAKLRHRRPKSFQVKAGVRAEVRTRFELDEINVVTFAFEGYDPALPLIIDPELVFSTFYGGSNEELTAALAADATFAYFAGVTNTVDFPVKNPVQADKKGLSAPGFGSTTDAFVVKLNTATREVVYSTLLGSSEEDLVTAIAIDSSGNAYISGRVGGADFPLRNPIISLATEARVFVTKLSAAGALQYSTLLGGDPSDSPGGIAVDSTGSAFIAGSTGSTNFPSIGGYQARGGKLDAFLIKLNPAGSSIVFSSVFGGSEFDGASQVTLDSGGNPIVAGVSNSPDFPRLNSFPGDAANATQVSFVTKFNASGSNLVFSTILGGGGNTPSGETTFAKGLATDSAGNIYVTGETSSDRFPLANPIQRFAGINDCFVTRLTPAGTVSFSTLIGSNMNDSCVSIAVDNANRAWVLGQSAAQTVPLVDAIQKRSAFPYPGPYIFQISSDGSSILFATYLGSAQGPTLPAAIAVSPTGSVFVAGSAEAGYPSVQSLQAAKSRDAYLSEIRNQSTCSYAISPTTPPPIAQSGGSLTFTVTTQAGCYWNAVSHSAILAIPTGSDSSGRWSEGTGTGTFTVTAPYAEGPDRVFYVTAAGKSVTLTQTGFGCEPAYRLTSMLPTSGGSTGFTISDRGGCYYTPTSDVPWITVSTGTTSSSGEVDFTVAPNLTGVARSGGIRFGSALHTVDQAGVDAAVKVTPPSLSVNGSRTLETLLFASLGAWSVKANQTWFRVELPRNGLGALDGGALIAVDRNPNTTPRTGTLSVNGQTVTIQQGPAIALTFDPPTLSIGAKGGSGTVRVTSNASDYTWYAQSVELNVSGSAYGNGTFTYTVPENFAASPRVLRVSVNDFTYTINQAAGAGLPVISSGLHFVPIPPCRLIDTREDRGAFGKPALAGATVRTFDLLSAGCATGTAKAYSLNVTVVPRGPLGYLTIWPAGSAQPFVSTLNSADGRVKANAAIVPAGLNGAISVYATDATELVVDINGIFTDTGGLSFYPVKPCRVADTREANGPLGGPVIPAGGVRTISVANVCGIPSVAEAVSLNATAVAKSPLGYVTLWQADQPQPFVSTLNAPKGGIVANAAIVRMDVKDAFKVFASDETHLVIDVNGYFAPAFLDPSNPQRYYALAPCRLLDTREPAGDLSGPALEPGQARSFGMRAANCNLPATATSYSLNATVVPQSVLGYLTLWPTGQTQPFVSTLNAVDDKIVANAAIVPVGTGGAVSAFVTDRTHLVIDTNGYFAP